MIMEIPGDHPIFSTAAYQRDIVPFSLMEGIRRLPKLLASDGSSLVIGMSSPEYPVWIWTAAAVSPDSIRELCGYCYAAFHSQSRVQFAVKPPLVQPLIERFRREKAVLVGILEMDSFECPRPLPAKNQTAEIGPPRPEDLESLADCFYRFAMECFGELREGADFQDKARRAIADENCAVIRENGQIAATARFSRETESHIAINGVYTRPEFRNRGYAAALVAHLSRRILDRGKTPCLYTDVSNPCSNKAYQSVGFQERGRVVEITLREETDGG